MKLVTGNPGRRPLNAAEPKLRRGVPNCPGFLTGRARRAFRELGKLLDGAAVLTIGDAIALTLLCDVYGEYLEARDVIRKLGMTYTSETEHGEIIRPRPEVAIAASAWSRTAKMLQEFGLTPSSRSRIKAGEVLAFDPMDEFLNDDGDERTA